MKLKKKLIKAITIAVIGIMSVSTTFASDLPVLTLQQAVSSALSADAAQQEAYRAERAASTQVMQDTDDVATVAYQKSYYSKLESEQVEKYHKDAVEYNTIKLYNSITVLQKQVDFCDERLAYQEKLFKQMEVKHNNGLVSQLDYETAESAIKEQRTAKEKLQAQLDKAREEFKLLAKYDTTKYSLEEKFEVEYYDYAGNINYFFDSSVDEMLQYQKKLIDVSADYTVSDGIKRGDNGALTYYNTKSSVTSAKAQLESTKEARLTTLNSLYSSLATLKQDIKELEVGIQDKEKTLVANRLKFSKGLISESEISKTELELNEAKLNLISKKVEYNTTKEAVRKPWVNFY